MKKPFHLLFACLLALPVSCSSVPEICDECDYECEGDHSAYLPVTAPLAFSTTRQSYRGTLVVGKSMPGSPAMQTFQPDGTAQLFWADADHSPEVRAYFERIIRSDQATGNFYKPRRITLNGYFQPKPRTGPASKCDGVFVATGMY